MSAYGVPEELDGALAWDWAEERLVPNLNYWLVTVDPAGRPHAMPVWGLWHRATERFWFSCDAGSRKARNLTSNPHVVVTTDDTVEVVSVEGIASAAAADLTIAGAYAEKYETDPVARDELATFVASGSMFVVEPLKAFGIIERPEEFGTRATRWAW